MARDDYFTIVYYILKYLYEALKQGYSIDESVIRLELYPEKISEKYYAYILTNMQNEGLI
ncbi:MAG: hypothetical protein GXZ11_03105 [Tissierellia bacterium]|nr:hypothetical protein [Tissierellia bacterium]